MADLFCRPSAAPTIPIHPVSADRCAARLAEISPAAVNLAAAAGFTGRAASYLLVPDADGRVAQVVLGTGDGSDRFALAALTQALPAGDYALSELPEGLDADAAALAWLVGDYRFDRYRRPTAAPERARLVPPKGADAAEAERIYAAVRWVRDLVNTPANDMGPKELEAAARGLAEEHGAGFECIVDEALLPGFPLVHAVGRGSANRPRLIDLRWGDPASPLVTLVGKGVCFDTGGLNIKTGDYMSKMKKDMGGGAHVLGLAGLIMGAKLPVRLRVLVSAVENSIGPDAFRPSDILPSRSGKSVEIGNTDAEGRLVLADALTYADEEAPELLIDMATLTGAARVALGPDLPPFYTDDDDLAAAIEVHAKLVSDPLWRMPLWSGYRPYLDSKVADISHISSVPMGGSITAALFLAEFVEHAKSWVHFDIFAWNDRARPGHTHGASTQAIRALYSMLKARYGS